MGVKKLSPTSLRGRIIQTLSPSLGRGRGVGIKKQNPLRMKIGLFKLRESKKI
ncbi:MAG: hypothetical protein ILP22_12475 [Oscillospiraceae bacterium]|nr:hypothetical protein [Oscillospiraceae bacterium]